MTMNATQLTSTLLGTALALSVLAQGVTPTYAYSERLRNACYEDYVRFCPSYKENSPKLRSCMRSHGRSLSKTCIRALIDAGYISRKDLQKR